MEQYDLLIENYSFLRAFGAITWSKKDWNELVEFARANGFTEFENGFSYMRIKHFVV